MEIRKICKELLKASKFHDQAFIPVFIPEEKVASRSTK